MINMEIDIAMTFPILVNPQHFIFRLDFRWVDPFVSQRNLVLFVIVNGRHLLDDSDEYGDGIFGKMDPGMPILY